MRYANLIRRKKFVYSLLLLTSLLTSQFSVQCHGQFLNLRFGDDELVDLAPELAANIKKLNGYTVPKADLVSQIEKILQDKSLPDNVRRKLKIRTAEAETDSQAKFSAYVALLDDSNPSKDTTLRRAALLLIQNIPNSSPKELKAWMKRIDEVCSPIKDIPSNDYDAGAASIRIVHAKKMREYGIKMASEIESEKRMAPTFKERIILAAKVRVYYVEQAQEEMEKLLKIIDKILLDRGIAKGEGLSPDPFLQDPLVYSRIDLETEVDEKQDYYIKDLELLKENHIEVEEKSVEGLIHQLVELPPK